MRRALISTITPIDGGVPQMTRVVAAMLREGGIAPELAYYQPYSINPGLSVPSFRLFARQVAKEVGEFEGTPAHAIGAWLPELEFTHYYPTHLWRDLIAGADYHLSVSGNCLAATPYAVDGRPFWSWVATPWQDDRADRVRRLPRARRLLDALIAARGARRLERKIVARGTVVALSEYTRTGLNRVNGGTAVRYVMPMAVDAELFRVKADQGDIPTVGFIGRLSDPRKNIELLLRAVYWCHTRRQPLRALLIGGALPPAATRLVDELGLSSHIDVFPGMQRTALPEFLNRLDAFVIPSHQEGLCIAALEAMACAVPVISTRCGGPQEFVVDGETGLLADNNPEALGNAIVELVGDCGARRRLGGNARELVLRDYSPDRVKQTFWESFEDTFPTVH